jgi:hypothetical protein
MHVRVFCTASRHTYYSRGLTIRPHRERKTCYLFLSLYTMVSQTMGRELMEFLIYSEKDRRILSNSLKYLYVRILLESQ